MITVSVIIPTWNRARTIEETIRSVLNQTYSDLEVLICDDGSTDNTEELVKNFTDPRIRWIKGPRGGRPAIPRNHGIRQSRGEWLAFLDSDDQWLPEKLEKQLELANKLGYMASCTNALRFIPGEGIVGNLLEWKKTRTTFFDLMKINQVICSSSIVHRSIFDKVVGFPEDPEVIEDYALWLRVATYTDFAYVDEPLVVYRDDAANSVRGMVTTDFWRQRQFVFKDYLEWAQMSDVKEVYRVEVTREYKHAIWKIKTRKLDEMYYLLKQAVKKLIGK